MSSGHFRWDLKKRMGFGCGVTNRKSPGWLGPSIQQRHLLLGRKAMTNLDSILKSRDITLLTKINKTSYWLSSSRVWTWELDHKEGWAPKSWCFWTVVLDKTLESPLDCEEIQPVHSKGDQSWVFTGGIDAEAETPVLWPPEVESWLIWKDPKGDDRGWDGWTASQTQWT